ncbi:MAG: hypothetical protein JW787_09095 [Sedimentisphaerales bacterium]|nr:hypothetical protein [Sedimentisphaerales bacterium]
MHPIILIILLIAVITGRTDFRYTQYINRMHKITGHLWEGRFYSCTLDNKGFWLASKYVELNPIRAKMCRLPWRYKWSSSAAHTGEKDKSRLLDLKKWNKMVTDKEWQKELLRGLDLEQISKLRLSTNYRGTHVFFCRSCYLT